MMERRPGAGIASTEEEIEWRAPLPGIVERVTEDSVEWLTTQRGIDVGTTSQMLQTDMAAETEYRRT